MRNNGTNQSNGTKEAVLAVPKEDPSTLFQRQRVDMLLAELVRQFPLPTTQPDTKPVIFLPTIVYTYMETQFIFKLYKIILRLITLR